EYSPFRVDSNSICHPAIADEESQKHCTYDTSDTMDSEGVEGIIETEFVFVLDGEVAKSCREYSKDNCTAGLHDTSGGSNGNKSGDNTTGEPESRCFALMYAFNDHPGHS